MSPPPAASAAPAPSAPQKAPEPAPKADKGPKDAKEPSIDAGEGEDDELPEGAIDYTKIPAEIDSRSLALDPESSLRPTIINPGKTWSKSFQTALLAKAESKTLNKSDIKQERERAFDLLDCLTRSGVLPIQAASLHVVMSATHCFDKTLMDTLVQESINPIEKVRGKKKKKKKKKKKNSSRK